MRKCTKCLEDKTDKHYSSRGVSKKTGKPLYNSWCKECSSSDQCRRNKRKPKKLKYFPLKKPINKKYLTRGLITIGNRGCSISCEA